MARVPLSSCGNKPSLLMRRELSRSQSLYLKPQHRSLSPAFKVFSTSPKLLNSSQANKQRSRHATWYSEILPSMVPIALLGFVVYGSLEVTRLYLAREKQSLDHIARIEQLEKEILVLQTKGDTPKPQDKNSISENRSSKPWKWLFG
ncbi:hypothetical protein CPB86DRAFT_778403 [Serendipita vermifera]|nr:hypothetical protein CPB86DRAFT_778403 [Serendipita vermifera]